jgi:hypothetical protein
MNKQESLGIALLDFILESSGNETANPAQESTHPSTANDRRGEFIFYSLRS